MTPDTTDFLPAEFDRFQARRGLFFALLFLILGLCLLLFGISSALASGEFNRSILYGAFNIAIGAIDLVQPYFSIAPNRLTTYDFFGAKAKRYPFATVSDIEIKNNKLVVRNANTGRWESTNIIRRRTRSRDWKKVESIIKQQ